MICQLYNSRRLCQLFESGKKLARQYTYFFPPRIPSFAALATRNLTTVLAGILIFCCVFGLKPVRAFLFCFTSLPKPGKTNSPFFLTFFVGERAERIEKDSSGSFVRLGGFGNCGLKFCLGHLKRICLFVFTLVV